MSDPSGPADSRVPEPTPSEPVDPADLPAAEAAPADLPAAEAAPPDVATAQEPAAAESAAIEGPPPLPTARQLISVGLDLALRASHPIRNASMAIGFQLLAAVGPLVLLLLVVAAKAPTVLDAAFAGATPVPGSSEEAVTAAFYVTLLVAIMAGALLTVESRIIAAALLGGAASGRPLTPHEALRRSRQVFWPVVAATIVIQVPINIVAYVLEAAITPVLGGSPEAISIVTLVATTLMTIPFAYILTGIVLGGATAGIAIQRSVALARVRWRLALVAAVADALTQTLLVFGLLAGLDIIGVVAAALGLGLDKGPVTTFATIALALLATAAAGSLLFTVLAIAAAPQVVAFVGLTRYTAAIDGAREGPAARPVRWVSIPMGIGIAFALLASILGVSAAMRPG